MWGTEVLKLKAVVMQNLNVFLINKVYLTQPCSGWKMFITLKLAVGILINISNLNLLTEKKKKRFIQWPFLQAGGDKLSVFCVINESLNHSRVFHNDSDWHWHSNWRLLIFKKREWVSLFKRAATDPTTNVRIAASDPAPDTGKNGNRYYQ